MNEASYTRDWADNHRHLSDGIHRLLTGLAYAFDRARKRTRTAKRRPLARQA